MAGGRTAVMAAYRRSHATAVAGCPPSLAATVATSGATGPYVSDKWVGLGASSLVNAFNTMTLQPPTASNDWSMDTGATAHMSSSSGTHSSLSSHPSSHQVMIGDGSVLPITHTSHSLLPSSNSSRPLHLHNVLVTPQIIKNLVSIRQFTIDNNCTRQGQCDEDHIMPVVFMVLVIMSTSFSPSHATRT